MQQTRAIENPIEALTFSVTLWAGRRLGPAVLEVTGTGLRLRCKYKSSAPPDGILDVPWNNIRELKDQLRRNHRFAANLGTGSLITVRIKDATPDRITSLANVFDTLPPEVSAVRCPACSGAVFNNICKDCGKVFTAEVRAGGAKRAALGVLLLGFGLLLTISTMSSFSLGHAGYMSWAVMLLGGYLTLNGVYWLVTGLLRFLFAVRAS